MQRLRLSRGGTLLNFRPVDLENLDELEAFWYLEPEAVENWLFNETPAAMEKIRSLLPYFESLDSPRTWPVLFLAIYDGIMTHPNPTPRMLYEVLKKYGENQNLVSNEFSELTRLEALILFRFLADWNPEFLRGYLVGNFREEIEREVREAAAVLEEGLPLVELVNRERSLRREKAGAIDILLRGEYLATELARLFQNDREKAIEVLFHRARTQNREDLQSIVKYRQSSYVNHWEEESFRPVLEELRNRFRGIPIKEMIERVARREEGTADLYEKELLGIFLLLPSDLENFVRNDGRWFLDYAKEDSSSGSDFLLEGSKKSILLMKLQVLFEVSPQAFDLLLNQLSDEEVAILLESLLASPYGSWPSFYYSENDLFPGDTFLEVAILERIYQLKGREWLEARISNVLGTRERSIPRQVFNRLLVYLKTEVSDELRDLLSGFFLAPYNVEFILYLENEIGLRRQIFRMSRVLTQPDLIQRLTRILEGIRNENRREILQSIIEELRSGNFQPPPLENPDGEERDEEILEKWRELRERWEREQEEREKSSEENQKTSSLPSFESQKLIENSL